MTKNQNHRFNQFQGELPIWLRWVVGNKENKKTFYRILLLSIDLLKVEGFALPHIKLARECGATRATISNWIKEAETKNFLICIEANFVPTVLARRYKAKGRLAEEMRQQLKNN